MQEKKLVIFDLGGVVFRHSFDSAVAYWAEKGGVDPAALVGRFRQDEAYAMHEVAEISIGEYKDHVCALLGIDLSERDFVDGWNAIFKEEIPGVRELVSSLRGPRVVVAFSNTNETHCRFMRVKYRDAFAAFDRIYFSHEIGLRKPEPEAFLRVLSDYSACPEEALFFDDVQENLDGARRVGIDTVLVSDGLRSISDGVSRYLSLSGA